MMLRDASGRGFPGGMSSDTLNVPGILGRRPTLTQITSGGGMPRQRFSSTFPSMALNPFVYGDTGTPNAHDSDGNDYGQRMQYHAINPRNSIWASTFLGQAELSFMKTVPPEFEREAVHRGSTELCPEIMALTLPMMNHYLRKTWPDALALYQTKKAQLDGLRESVLGSERLLWQTQQSPFGRQGSPLGLLDEQITALRFAFGVGIMQEFRYLGAIQAQPNPLYEPKGGSGMQSMTAEHGQTTLSVQKANLGYVRSYWDKDGMINGRNLFLVLRPYDSTSKDCTGKTVVEGGSDDDPRQIIPAAGPDYPLQFVPYVAPGLSGIVPMEERRYRMVNGELTDAKVIHVGVACEAESYRGTDKKTICSAAGLGYATNPNVALNDTSDFTTAFNAAASLPMQRFRCKAVPLGLGLDFTN
jgi:hypothetical protein